MAEEQDPSYTIVEYMSDHSGYRCGYCKSDKTNFSHGMWAHKMTVQDYQDLIDRGWRRSGKYCYKPTMNKTCCPQYTIKCNALEFKLSKSQKKVLKRMNRYLVYGDVKSSSGNKEDDNTQLENGLEVGENSSQFIQPAVPTKHDLSNVKIKQSSKTNCSSSPIAGQGNSTEAIISNSVEDTGNEPINADENSRVQLPNSSRENITDGKQENVIPKPGIGADPNRPSQKKAKEIRKERRESKLAAKLQDAELRGETPMESETKKHKGKNNITKSLEDFLNEPMRSAPTKPAHKLELRLVRANSSAFKATFNDAYMVFKKYQMAIHKEKEDECERSSYNNFLVDGPLAAWTPSGGPSEGFGSFHQQYWLDDKLIAVGVLDVLPQCLSSVYLFYDPDYAFLSLGSYASLRETALVREIQRQGASDFQWYYMGFYIHSCTKMRYKGQLTPSFLLCPDTYTWEPIEPCIPLLDANKYARLNQDQNEKDTNANMDIKKVLCLYQREEVLYHLYSMLNPDTEDDQEVREYSSLVGSKCAQSILLYRS